MLARIVRWHGQARANPALSEAEGSARATQFILRGIIPHQAENEVPQPQDFEAWGFTKTKPCCISVS
jgi:hypothetical protein